MTYDCQACGACCRDVSCKDTAIVLMSEEEASLIPAKYVRRLTVLGHSARAGFARVSDEVGMATDEHGRCAALHGRIGKKVSCLIYPLRPSICMRFEPNGPGCRRAREDAGLPITDAGDAAVLAAGAAPGS